MLLSVRLPVVADAQATVYAALPPQPDVGTSGSAKWQVCGARAVNSAVPTADQGLIEVYYGATKLGSLQFGTDAAVGSVASYTANETDGANETEIPSTSAIKVLAGTLAAGWGTAGDVHLVLDIMEAVN
jgi:hypothetical protein